MAFKIVISYSTLDLPVVNSIRDALRVMGFDVFVAEHSVSPGQSLTKRIESAIRQCDLFVLLWSTNATGSSWVPQEIGIARGAKRPMYPLVLEEGIGLPAFLQDMKYLPLYQEPETALARLRTHVERLAKKQQGEPGGFPAVLCMGAGLWALSRFAR